MAKTISVVQDGPANALALNSDNSHVVIAGRNVFKIFAIGEDEFIESLNLRVGKNINLNYSCNDVAWNTSDDHILATAATNGAVVVWNLNRVSRSKQDHVFSEHKRTVNKVCFNSSEPQWLMSGSQDGTMKMFDLRIKEAVKTFDSNTESVRDVQFSPHSQSSFASVSENGNVQTWDVRKPDRCVLQFTAHSGPVFACDWHPDAPWLATASRDKTIKIWEMGNNKPSLEHTIHTIASVGRVKWRPQYKYHIASVALVVDSSVNVWDVRRPYIPYASFTDHKDITTGIAWRGDPKICLSTSRDCTLYQHSFKDATFPSACINPQALRFNPRGELAFATRVMNPYKTNKSSKKGSSLTSSTSGHLPSEEFWQASSMLFMFSRVVNKELDWFLTCAKEYILTGTSLSHMCDHNSQVARDLGRLSVSLLWLTVKALYTSCPLELISTESPSKDNQIESGSAIDKKKKFATTEFKTETLSRRTDSGMVNEEDNTLGEFYFGDNDADPLSLEFELNGFDGSIQQDWALPSEAFPLRQEPEEASPPEQTPNGEASDLPEDARSCISEEGGQNISRPALMASAAAPCSGWSAVHGSATLVGALRAHAAQGDTQTAVCVLIALGDKRASLLDHIDAGEQETWLLSYLDQLAAHQLWVHSNLITKNSWISTISELNQNSTTIHTGCVQCNRVLNQNGWHCIKCERTITCSVCHEVVKGLFAWCQGCMHGGHLSHIQEWLQIDTHCPTGCGHICEYS